MIFGEHRIGAMNDLTVRGGAGDGSTGALMTITVDDWFMGHDVRASEALTRADVERLRDLCEEALA